MINDKKIVFCPYCRTEHEVFLRGTEETVTKEGITYSFVRHYYWCGETLNDFSDGEMMDENILSSIDAFRSATHLLTSNEISSVRKKYGLFQKDFSLLLGLGEITITRYETKSVQNRSNDELIRRASEEPSWLIRRLMDNPSLFEPKKFNEIYKNINAVLTTKSRIISASRNDIENSYYGFKTPLKNGKTALDIGKVEAIAQRLIEKGISLTKTKFAKLLWYIDAKSFKETGRAITGLVYTHQQFGALPIRYNEILDLPSFSIEETCFDDCSRFVITKCDTDTSLSSSEEEIVSFIFEKFSSFSTENIVEYMHQEKAYLETSNGQIISFEFARELSI